MIKSPPRLELATNDSRQADQPHEPYIVGSDASEAGDSHANIRGGQNSPTAKQPFEYNALLHPTDHASPPALSAITSLETHSHRGMGLHLQTDIVNQTRGTSSARATPPLETGLRHVSSTSSLPHRSSSTKSMLSATPKAVHSLSPTSAISSPGLSPLLDISPLPSPTVTGVSPEIWRRAGNLPESLSPSIPKPTPDLTYESMVASQIAPKKRRTFRILTSSTNGTDLLRSQISHTNDVSHAKNRTLSEYVPESKHVPRSRNICVSGSGAPSVTEHPSPLDDQHMHREQYLAGQRGFVATTQSRPPTPPRSNKSGADDSDLESSPPSPSRDFLKLRFEAQYVRTRKTKRWRAIRKLGRGTFSTVVLATSEGVDSSNELTSGRSLLHEDEVDPKTLVAVKICERGPVGGADEKKTESSLKRELDILRSINHPSLVHLKAVNILDTRVLLILNYCPGGDLFELASLKLELLTPPLVRRIFAELVAAVRYLHLQYIVHRDIKLENILVNLPTSALLSISDWRTYPFPIVTLADLGLGRRIPEPPASPLLDTRCGSEDYAAPELLMGQEYDGRATDAWALGVVLYAIMEGRLPFDPAPGSRSKSPTSHRIARCEWSWVRWAGKDGEWDEERGGAAGLDGGKDCVEWLLKRARSRWGLEKVESSEWVREGMEVDGGLRRGEDDDELET